MAAVAHVHQQLDPLVFDHQAALQAVVQGHWD